LTMATRQPATSNAVTVWYHGIRVMSDALMMPVSAK
jgi:hypothetical protein